MRFSAFNLPLSAFSELFVHNIQCYMIVEKYCACRRMKIALKRHFNKWDQSFDLFVNDCYKIWQHILCRCPVSNATDVQCSGHAESAMRFLWTVRVTLLSLTYTTRTYM